MKYKKGQIVVAAHTITAGLFSPEVFVNKGTKLIIRGISSNGLHPIAVSKLEDEHFHFAVSERDIILYEENS